MREAPRCLYIHLLQCCQHFIFGHITCWYRYVWITNRITRLFSCTNSNTISTPHLLRPLPVTTPTRHKLALHYDTLLLLRRHEARQSFILRRDVAAPVGRRHLSWSKSSKFPKYRGVRKPRVPDTSNGVPYQMSFLSASSTLRPIRTRR